MKRIYSTAGWLVVAAALTIGMTACSGGEDTIMEEPQPTGLKTYTMTVNATMDVDAATTRALSLDGKTLAATWTKGDKVAVLILTGDAGMEHWELLGELTAANVSVDGLSCTLTGDITEDHFVQAGRPTVGSYLRLIYPGTRATSSGYSIWYTGQDGTLGKIATDYDYCSTSPQKSKAVTVTAVDGSHITTSTATFTNNQAIVRFTLTDKDGNPIYPTSLTISAKKKNGSESLVTGEGLTGYSGTMGTGALTINLNGTTNEVYAALRGVSGGDITLTAFTANRVYSYTKTGVTFTDGKYYTIAVKNMNSTVTLDNLSDGNFTAENGDVLTGNLPSGTHLYIDNNATVTLRNVTINETSSPGINCIYNAHIILEGTNTITTYADCPAIRAGSNSNCTLTISGSGTLTATGGKFGAGIGSGSSGSCGNIIISGGTIIATGGESGAGIGSGELGSCGKITISGGTVTASGGFNAAGIGSVHFHSCCGDISISGGTITATGGSFAAGIGSGDSGECGAITIGSGISSVTAIKGGGGLGYPIGKGSGTDSTCGTVTIDGTTSWSAGTATEHLNFTVSTTNYTNDTWTLTH